MNKEKIRSYSIYLLVALLFLVIAAFLGWYLWFSSERTALETWVKIEGLESQTQPFPARKGVLMQILVYRSAQG